MTTDVLNDPEVRRSFEEELLFGEATETVSALIASLGITQRELAKRLGVSESRVSQMLSGSENLTLRSLAAVGWALGIRFELDPQALASRNGTPAMDDPPAPAWLRNLGPQPVVEFRFVERPSEIQRTSYELPRLRVVGGGRSIAA